MEKIGKNIPMDIVQYILSYLDKTTTDTIYRFASDVGQYEYMKPLVEKVFHRIEKVNTRAILEIFFENLDSNTDVLKLVKKQIKLTNETNEIQNIFTFRDNVLNVLKKYISETFDELYLTYPENTKYISKKTCSNILLFSPFCLQTTDRINYIIEKNDKKQKREFRELIWKINSIKQDYFE